MGRRKIDPLEVKEPYSVGIRRKVASAFDSKIQEFGLCRSTVVESLMEEFLNQFKDKL